MADFEDRPDGLIAWQWSLYPGGHTTRTNLAIHIATVPVFHLGTLLLVGGIAFRAPVALLGPVLMAGAMAAQGRGHASEPQAPARFRGPLDVIARIFMEQWFTFPRYVLNGSFARAWKSASARRA